MRSQHASLLAIHTKTHLYREISGYGGFFRNKIYIGILVYAGREYPSYCEPIVSPETWERVQLLQAKFAGRRHVGPNRPDHPRRISSDHLLTGIVTCLQCGSPMVGNISLAKGHEYRSYRCTSAKNRHDCTAPAIPADLLEAETISSIEYNLLQPKILADILERTQTDRESYLVELDEEIASKRHELGQVQASIRRLHKVIAEAGHTSSILETLKEYEGQRAEIQARLQDLEQAAAVTPDQRLPDQNEIAMLCDRTLARLKTGEMEERRRTLQGLVKGIAVERNEISIHGIMKFFSVPIGGNVVAIEECPRRDVYYSHNFSFPYIPGKWRVRKSR
jgi:hypothetical protein